MRVDVHKEPVKTDVKDLKILKELALNSRKPLNAIAKKVMLSPDSVRYRIDRMTSSGIIVRFIPDVSLRNLGYSKYSLFLQLIEDGDEKEKRLINNLVKNKSTISVMQYSDKFDFEVVIIAKTQYELQEIMNDIATKNQDIIADMHVVMQTHTYKSIFYPQKIANLNRKKPIEVKFDDMDLKLLSELSNNSRESSYILADKLKCSVDKILYRIKKLEQGVIDDYTTVINLSALGYSWYTFLVSLKYLSKKDESKLIEFARSQPNILRCFRGIGNWDLIFYIVSLNPMEFHKIVNSFRANFREIVKDYDTLLAYKEYKKCEFPRDK